MASARAWAAAALGLHSGGGSQPAGRRDSCRVVRDLLRDDLLARGAVLRGDLDGDLAVPRARPLRDGPPAGRRRLAAILHPDAAAPDVWHARRGDRHAEADLGA